MNPSLAVPMNPQRRLRGAFINTAAASCSIFESGLMVYNCIRTSEAYSLDYFSLDMIDIPTFNATGMFRPLADLGSDLGPYDFWVFNWHFVTMAMLDPKLIAKLPGCKFTIVLELQPDNPVGMVPPDVFDGYIALDPAARATQTIFPFPRPLEGEARRPQSPVREIPVIGSFGFGTPGKGFELLVEAVNREFERAVVRVNIPTGTHVAATVNIHRRDYPQYLAALCRQIAKPGIDVQFSHDFLTSDQLITWCADNDLNCFMYTRCQPGLAATTDQAVMSGRPLLTLSNDTFRHIHRYIPAYPAIGLREAIATTPAAVQHLQQEWSKATFNSAFHDMLAAFRLLPAPISAVGSASVAREEPPTVLVASQFGFGGAGIIDYSTRLADALSRSGGFAIERERCNDVAELRQSVLAVRPAAVIVVGFEGESQCGTLADALESVTGPKIVMTEPGSAAGAAPVPNDGLDRVSRQPIVPFYTFFVGLNPRPAIALIGFSAENSNLEELLKRIVGELAGADVLIEAPAALAQKVANRATAALNAPGGRPDFRFTVAPFGVSADEVFTAIGRYNLGIFWHDPSRTRELEDISSLAMITERAVAFSRRSPFLCYGNTVTYADDMPLVDLMSLGMASKIRTLHDFGEWQVAARIGKLLAPIIPSAGPEAWDTSIHQPAASAGEQLAAAPTPGPAAVALPLAPVPTISIVSQPSESLHRGAGKPRLVIASDRTFAANDRRMRRSALLYTELGQTFDIVAVTRTAAGEAPALVRHAPGFVEHRVPRTNAEAEWQTIARDRWGVVAGDDAQWFDRVAHLNTPFTAALRSALTGAVAAVCVGPYAFGVVRALSDEPIIYDGLELEYRAREIASRTAPNRIEFIEKIAALETECVRGSAAIISGDQMSADLTAFMYKIDRQRVAVLRGIHDAAILPPLGDARRQERRAASVVKGAGPIVLFVGSQKPSNARAVSALVAIAAQLPNVNFCLAGHINEIAAGEIRRNNINLLGYVDDATLTTLLEIADVFVHPAVDARVNIARKVLDAVAHGAPIVLTPEAAAGVFRDAHDADVVPLDALPARIAGLLNDPLRRERQSIRARETLTACYSPATAAAPIIELIRALLPVGIPA